MSVYSPIMSGVIIIGAIVVDSVKEVWGHGRSTTFIPIYYGRRCQLTQGRFFFVFLFFDLNLLDL